MIPKPLSATELSALEELEHAESIDGHEAAFDLLDKRRPTMSRKDLIILIVVVTLSMSVVVLQFTEVLPYDKRFAPFWYLLPMPVGALFRWFWPDDPNSDERRIAKQLSKWHLQRVQSATKAHQ